MSKEYVMKLAEEFDKYRPFGDERDFEMLKPCKKHSKIMCEIYKKPPLLYPELALNPDNLVDMCEACVINAIEFFKEIPDANNLTPKGDIT